MTGTAPLLPRLPPVPDLPPQFKESVLKRPPYQSPWLYLGLGLLLTAAVAYGLLWLSDRTQAIAVTVALGTMFAAGKESALPAALFSFSGNPIVVATALIWVDLGASLVFYPFIAAAVAGAEHSHGRIWGFVGGVIRSTHRRAAKKRALLDKYGGWGLFLFLIVPFAFNGPPIGMVLARIVGLRTRSILTAVAGAIIATTAAWTITYEILIEHGLKQLPVPGWLPSAVAITIAAVALTLTFVEGAKERKREKSEA